MLTCKFIEYSICSISFTNVWFVMEGSNFDFLKSSKGAGFCKYSWRPHQSGPMSDMFDIIQEHISWHDICLGTNLKLNSRKNKYANHGYCQNLIEFYMIYAFQVGLFYISVFLPFLAYACHVSKVCVCTTAVVVLGMRLHDRYFTHVRLLDDGRLWDNDKMFILKAFTPLQAPDCLTLAQIES